jgi:hypothetical protein
MNDKDFLDFMLSNNILMHQAVNCDFFNLLVKEGDGTVKSSLIDYFNSLAYKIIVRNKQLNEFNSRKVTPLQFIFTAIKNDTTGVVQYFMDNNASKYVAKFVVSEKLGRSITEKIPDTIALKCRDELTPLNSEIVFGMISEENEDCRKILVNQLLGILKENVSQQEAKSEYLECSICKEQSSISSLQNTGSEALKDMITQVVDKYEEFSAFDNTFKGSEERSIYSDAISQSGKDIQKTSWLNWLYNFVSYPFRKVYQYLYPEDNKLSLTAENLKSLEVKKPISQVGQSETASNTSSTQTPSLKDHL